MPRLEFTTDTQRQALKRSQGICECHLIPHVFPIPCGRPLGTGNTFFEHIVPDQLKPDNSLDNCAALTKTCWKIKTATYDLKVIAKSKRNFDSDNGIRRPKQRLPGGRRDPFKFTPGSTTPIDRKTGAIWKKTMTQSSQGDDARLGASEQWFTCEACDGSGVEVFGTTVYEPGCGFPHSSTDERPCSTCGGAGGRRAASQMGLAAILFVGIKP